VSLSTKGAVIESSLVRTGVYGWPSHAGRITGQLEGAKAGVWEVQLLGCWRGQSSAQLKMAQGRIGNESGEFIQACIDPLDAHTPISLARGVTLSIR